MDGVTSTKPDDPSSVRLPRALADYACRRSLLCCRPPWRVHVTDADLCRIEERIVSNPEVDDSAWNIDELFQSLGGNGRLMLQTDTRCVLLDERRPACRLQAAGGLDSLPGQCRNFPRSVVGTPLGTEAAFLMDCPTVSGIVADMPQRFDWAKLDEVTWRFPAYRPAPERYWWTAAQSISFTAIEELRAAWWAALDVETSDESDGARLLSVLQGMAAAPDDPNIRIGQSIEPPSESFGPEEAAVALSFVLQLPAREARYRDGREALFDALQATYRPDALIAAADERADSLACLAGLLVQHAGVHDDLPVSDGIRAAAQQVLLTLVLSMALARGAEVSPRDALRDALTAAAHINRYRRYTRLVFVD